MVTVPKKTIRKGKRDGRKDNKFKKDGRDGVGASTRFTTGHQPKNKLLRTILREKGFDRETINEIFAGILTSNPNQLTEMKLDQETSMLELIGISGVEAAIRSADFGRMEWLLTQILGKQVQRTENVNYNMNMNTEVDDDDVESAQQLIERRAREIAKKP